MLKWIQFLYKYIYNVYNKNFKFIKNSFWVFISITLIIIPFYFAYFIKNQNENETRLKKYNQFIQVYIKVLNNLEVENF